MTLKLDPGFWETVPSDRREHVLRMALVGAHVPTVSGVASFIKRRYDPLESSDFSGHDVSRVTRHWYLEGQMRMPFGKHKGEPLEDLPLDYLHWLAEECELREPLLTEVQNQIELKNGRGVARKRGERIKHGD